MIVSSRSGPGVGLAACPPEAAGCGLVWVQALTSRTAAISDESRARVRIGLPSDGVQAAFSWPG
jgi:hypothetical protein